MHPFGGVVRICRVAVGVDNVIVRDAPWTPSTRFS